MHGRSGLLPPLVSKGPGSVFGWFEIPATFYGFGNQEDIAGVVHEWLANLMIELVVLHSLAALKHHFLDCDPTLRRMLGLGGTRTCSSSITTRPEE